MKNKKNLFGCLLALVSAAQADSSCDVTSRFYGGIGLGYVRGSAPILRSKRFYDQMIQATHSQPTTFSNFSFHKKNLRGLATRLALGGHFLVPNTCAILGAEVSFGFTGAKGHSRLSFDGKNNLNQSWRFDLHRKLRDRFNVTFAGILGAKVGPVLPYLKVGVGLHSFKWVENFNVQELPALFWSDYSYSEARKKTAALFVIGVGVDYNVTKNIVVGAEWTHRRGKLGVYKEAQKAREIFVDPEAFGVGRLEESNKVHLNEFMLTCKYAFPVTR